MTPIATLRRLIRNRRAATAIEFGLLAPALMILLIGVLMVGQHMHDYNALRSVAFDVNRYTVVEYQKGNKMDEDQIEQVAAAIATRAPYNFHADRLDAAVTTPFTAVSGAKRFRLVMAYTPPAFALPMEINPPTIRQVQSIIVPD